MVGTSLGIRCYDYTAYSFFGNGKHNLLTLVHGKIGRIHINAVLKEGEAYLVDEVGVFTLDGEGDVPGPTRAGLIDSIDIGSEYVSIVLVSSTPPA